MLTKEWVSKEWVPFAPMTKEEWAARDWKMIKYWRFEYENGGACELGVFVFDMSNVVAVDRITLAGLSGKPLPPRYRTADVRWNDPAATVEDKISEPFGRYSRNWCQDACARFWEKYARAS